MAATSPAFALARAELDELTLRRAQRGEPAAFRALVDRYHRAVWDLAVRMLAGTSLGHRAEDLVQETFVRVHRAIAGFDPRGAARLSTWILTIASRLVLNELRRAPRAAATRPIDDAIDVADHDDPARTCDARTRARRLVRAIAELPDAARAVIVLREFHDLDYDEIAAALELEPGTVKSRLARARAQLRERLRDLGDDHE